MRIADGSCTGPTRRCFLVVTTRLLMPWVSKTPVQPTLTRRAKSKTRFDSPRTRTPFNIAPTRYSHSTVDLVSATRTMRSTPFGCPVSPYRQLASFSSCNRPSSVVFHLVVVVVIVVMAQCSRPVEALPSPFLSLAPLSWPITYRLPAFNNFVLTHKINEVQTDAVRLLVETFFPNSSSSIPAVSGLAPTSASS